MTKTILIDLDDTLLGNNMDTFIPAYLGALGEHIADITPPDKMVKTMLMATQKMFENNLPNRTLKEAFDPYFYPPQGLIEKDVRHILDEFYCKKFPSLQTHTQVFPAAVAFIDAALDRKYNIGIATNPLFPRTAITQRLAWAGLCDETHPFSLIPSYETFHFSKPNPAYFAEFLGKIGWPDGSILMVGNDLDHDVRGAKEMGIPVFWIENQNQLELEGSITPDGSGQLSDLLAWIDSRNEDDLQPNFTSQTAMIAILRGSPAAILGLLGEIDPSLWNQAPTPGEWSLTEITCHLRDVEKEINLPRIVTGLTETNPFISGVDSDIWAVERNYRQQDGPQALQDFVITRIKLLKILDKFTETDWKRPIRHAIFGPTNLQDLIRIMTAHERLHGRQIYQTLQVLQSTD